MIILIVYLLFEISLIMAEDFGVIQNINNYSDEGFCEGSNCTGDNNNHNHNNHVNRKNGRRGWGYNYYNRNNDYYNNYYNRNNYNYNYDRTRRFLNDYPIYNYYSSNYNNYFDNPWGFLPCISSIFGGTYCLKQVD
jgi:hypothetical protein